MISNFDTNFDAAFHSPKQDIDPTTDLLIRARGFLERGWCRGEMARNAEEQSVDPRSTDAVQWCAYGSLWAAETDATHILDWREAIDRLVNSIAGKIIFGTSAELAEIILVFNETQETVEPILAAFDRAIAASRPVAVGT